MSSLEHHAVFRQDPATIAICKLKNFMMVTMDEYYTDGNGFKYSFSRMDWVPKYSDFLTTSPYPLVFIRDSRVETAIGVQHSYLASPEEVASYGLKIHFDDMREFQRVLTLQQRHTDIARDERELAISSAAWPATTAHDRLTLVHDWYVRNDTWEELQRWYPSYVNWDRIMDKISHDIYQVNMAGET